MNVVHTKRFRLWTHNAADSTLWAAESDDAKKWLNQMAMAFTPLNSSGIRDVSIEGFSGGRLYFCYTANNFTHYGTQFGRFSLDSLLDPSSIQAETPVDCSSASDINGTSTSPWGPMPIFNAAGVMVGYAVTVSGTATIWISTTMSGWPNAPLFNSPQKVSGNVTDQMSFIYPGGPGNPSNSLYMIVGGHGYIQTASAIGGPYGNDQQIGGFQANEGGFVLRTDSKVSIFNPSTPTGWMYSTSSDGGNTWPAFAQVSGLNTSSGSPINFDQGQPFDLRAYGLPTGRTLTFQFITKRADTAVLTNADSTPSGTLAINGIDQPTTVSILGTAVAGVYTASAQPPELYRGDVVQVRASALVNSVPGTKNVYTHTDESILSLIGVPANETVSQDIAALSATQSAAASQAQVILDELGWVSAIAAMDTANNDFSVTASTTSSVTTNLPYLSIATDDTGIAILDTGVGDFTVVSTTATSLTISLAASDIEGNGTNVGDYAVIFTADHAPAIAPITTISGSPHGTISFASIGFTPTPTRVVFTSIAPPVNGAAGQYLVFDNADGRQVLEITSVTFAQSDYAVWNFATQPAAPSASRYRLYAEEPATNGTIVSGANSAATAATTATGIKSQTDKLGFDGSDNVYANARVGGGSGANVSIAEQDVAIS